MFPNPASADIINSFVRRSRLAKEKRARARGFVDEEDDDQAGEEELEESVPTLKPKVENGEGDLQRGGKVSLENISPPEAALRRMTINTSKVAEANRELHGAVPIPQIQPQQRSQRNSVPQEQTPPPSETSNFNSNVIPVFGQFMLGIQS